MFTHRLLLVGLSILSLSTLTTAQDDGGPTPCEGNGQLFTTRARPFSLTASYVTGFWTVNNARVSRNTTHPYLSTLSLNPPEANGQPLPFNGTARLSFSLEKGVLLSNVAKRPFAYYAGKELKDGTPFGVQFVDQETAAKRGLKPIKFRAMRECMIYGTFKLRRLLLVPADQKSGLTLAIQLYGDFSGEGKLTGYLGLIPNTTRVGVTKGVANYPSTTVMQEYQE